MAASGQNSDWRAVRRGAVAAMLVASLVSCADQGPVQKGHLTGSRADAEIDREPGVGPAQRGYLIGIRADVETDRAPGVASSPPTQSDGWRQIVTNVEYGIRAAFPDGRVVCENRSWEHPYGFYAILNSDEGCDARAIDGVLRLIAIRAHYNTTDMTSAGSDRSCRNGSVPAGIDLDIRDLKLDERETFACAEIEPDGEMRVILAALGEEVYEHGPTEPRIPLVEYVASLSTSRDHLGSDFELFRRFVDRIELLPLG